MQISEVSGGPQFLWAGKEWSGVCAGLAARNPNNVTNDRVICGDFSSLLVAFWSEAVELLPDPYARKKEGLVESYATVFADTAAANAANCAVSTDSGAQYPVAFAHSPVWQPPAGILKAIGSGGKFGALAVRFSDRSEPDLQNEYFTSETDFGARR
jgi:hypothetical protein